MYLKAETINVSDFTLLQAEGITNKKSDIKLRIYDHRLAKEEDLGFSIKSLIGQDSTLFNPGPGNNFIYEIESRSKIDLAEFNKLTYKPPGRVSKITARLLRLKEMGLEIKFKGIQSEQLYKNLKMIDGDLPELLGQVLLSKWLNGATKLRKVVDLLEEEDPLNYYNKQQTKQRFYDYKLKRFLSESAMGMTPETPWLGIYDATGGVIIAKADGDIVCFHIYNFNLFREYLLENTKFEQPSTGENENNPGTARKSEKGDKSKTKKYYYGWLYEEEGKYRFKINLQIRFI